MASTVRKAWLVALVAAAALAVGCIGAGDDAIEDNDAAADKDTMPERANVPELPAELGEIRDFEAEADDGTALRGHVYIPEGEGPFATVLLYYPYWNGGGAALPASDSLAAEEDGRRTLVDFHGLRDLMDAGFAIAAVNTRGTGISDGCYSYMNHPDNGPDANAVVDALADEPWSRDEVGMYGLSYGGATQFAALASDTSPHLEATVPVSGEWDEWNLLGYWGAPATWSAVHPTYRNTLQGLGMGGALFGPLTEEKVYRPTPEHWCAETVQHKAAYEEYTLTGDKTPFMQERDLREGLKESQVPIFATNGMTDGEGHILQFEGLWDLIPHQDKRLLVGQWPHGFPFEDAQNFTDDHVVPWLDHYLRDGPPVETGVVTYEDSDERLHNSTAWPPAEANLTPLFLSDGELVSEEAAVEASDQAFVTDDANVPYPSDCPLDAAVYASPPLEEDVLVAGNFFVNFTATSTQPDENVAAYLWTGEEVPSCPATGDEGLTEHRYALSDLAHRGHREQGEAFPVDGPGLMEMRSIPMAEVLPEGSRIVLAIGAGHPDLLPTGTPTRVTIPTGADAVGELHLPVVDGELAFEQGGAEAASVASPPSAG